jgi:hypothetical protein
LDSKMGQFLRRSPFTDQIDISNTKGIYIYIYFIYEFFFWQKEKIYKIKQRGTRLDWIFLIRHPKLNPTVSTFIFGADEFLSQNRFKPTMNTLTFIKREFRLPPYSFSLAPYEFSKILMYAT